MAGSGSTPGSCPVLEATGAGPSRWKYVEPGGGHGFGARCGAAPPDLHYPPCGRARSELRSRTIFPPSLRSTTTRSFGAFRRSTLCLGVSRTDGNGCWRTVRNVTRSSLRTTEATSLAGVLCRRGRVDGPTLKLPRCPSMYTSSAGLGALGTPCLPISFAGLGRRSSPFCWPGSRVAEAPVSVFVNRSASSESVR